MAEDFISLHNRSAYSFGSALTMPKQLVEFAAVQGMAAIALTDLDGLYAAVEFQQACHAAGIKPIFGAELRVAAASSVRTTARAEARGSLGTAGIKPIFGAELRVAAASSVRTTARAEARGSLGADLIVTLLARDLAGYGNLCRLISLHHLRDEGLGPADLGEHAGGLICLLGGAADADREWLLLRDAFAGRLYIELSIHQPSDAALARRRARLADELGLPVVATCESRCPRREDGPVLKALASIGTLTLLDQPHPDKPVGDWHLRTPAEMARLFARRPDALANTLAIAEQCNVALDLSRNRFPAFASPDGRGAIEHLRDLAVAGCRRRYVDEPPLRGIGGYRPTLDEALARLDRELSIIEQVHYAEYFLVFHEIAEHCRREGISFLARGSAADSLVCYALGVSHACPFRFDLPFDRFINPERAKFSKMADIDLDLPWDQRDQVIRWVYDRWGHDRVAMIGAPNTYHARAAVAELGKVYGLPPQEVHRATRLLPHYFSGDLHDVIARSPEARDVPVHEEPYRTILRMAGKFEGLPRHWAMHPCGLVVSPEPLTDLAPVQRSPKNLLVAQYDMDAVEDLGFVKVDLLGQAGLSVLRDAVEEINTFSGAARGTEHRASPTAQAHFVDLGGDVDYSDPATWSMIARGDARGVHHIESPAMTSLLQQCNCRDIDCLTAVVAVIRPGAANQGKKEAFARRYQGLEAPSYAHPSLKAALEKTYGLMVFEEHILQVAVEFAGMNLGRADVLRRALNKQKFPLIAELKSEFYASALLNGRQPSEINVVWPLLEGFSGFMFNKAHSAEYAVEAFQGGWLKLRWPAQYIAAILSNYRGFYAGSPTLPQILYVMEALRLGIGFLPPCVNRSARRFSVENAEEHGRSRSAIRVPISHINGLSQAFLDRYVAERANRPFSSLADFVHRCRPSDAEAQSLLDAGAFDCFDGARPIMFWQLRKLLRNGNAAEATLFCCLEDRFTAGQRAPLRVAAKQEVAAKQGAAAKQGVAAKQGAAAKQGVAAKRDIAAKQEITVRFSAETAGTSLMAPAGQDDAAPPVALTEPDAWQIARREMELLGFPITIDPLTFLGRDDKGRDIDWRRYVPVADLHKYHGRRVAVCGLMVADRINPTVGGDLMKFVTLADRTGFIEAVLFPDAYRRFGHLTVANPILAAAGVVEPFENRNGFTFRVQSVSVPARGIVRADAKPVSTRRAGHRRGGSCRGGRPSLPAC